MNAYNVHWNLERDLVDELDVVEVYPVGNIQTVDLENMYIHNLLGSFISRLLDLCSIGDTLNQVMSGGSRDTISDSGLSVGLQLLQKHSVKLDNDQIISSDLRKLQSSRATTLTFPRSCSPSHLSLEIFNGSRIWVRTHFFEDENVSQS